MALSQYLRLRNNGYNVTKASMTVVMSLGWKPWSARRIVNWSKEWFKNHELYRIKVNISLLSHEDIHLKVSEYLKENKFTVTPLSLQKYVNNYILPSCKISTTIHEHTALNWLKKEGWVLSEVKKGWP